MDNPHNSKPLALRSTRTAVTLRWRHQTKKIASTTSATQRVREVILVVRAKNQIHATDNWIPRAHGTTLDFAARHTRQKSHVRSCTRSSRSLLTYKDKTHIRPRDQRALTLTTDYPKQAYAYIG